MAGLSARDLSGMLEFIELAWSASGEQAFPRETLDALGRLIPCDAVTYADLHRLEETELEAVSTGGLEEVDDDVFWEIQHEHPLCRHQQAYADFSATRLSDVVTRRRLTATRVYADWFRPLGVTAELEVGISRSRVRTRNFILDRAGGDFSDRDRQVLDGLAPHLARIHGTAMMARQVSSPAVDTAPLTPRETEIVELVAHGLTNGQIAERLWIAPGTVKKHLDNVYGKLGVSKRAALAARFGRGGRAESSA